jgi:Immunity protein 50
MTKSDSGPQLPGSDKVCEWFGYWPDFHDAEIVSLNLSRSGDSVLRVYPYAPQKPATVDFFLSEIVGLELWDFSSQNVISSLDIETVKRENGEMAFRVEMHPCYGLAGHVDAKGIRVSLTPGKSADGVSLW